MTATAQAGTPAPAICYHPDPEINAEVIAEAIEGERANLAAGFPPRRWRCPDCGGEHSRGHVAATIGVHRCLSCGYTGTGGVMLDEGEEATEQHPLCPGGCGCRLGTDDADRFECGCDEGCCGE